MTTTSSNTPGDSRERTESASSTAALAGAAMDAGVAPTVVLSPEGYDPESLEKVKIRGRLRRLMLWMLFANVGIFMLWGAIPGILLPLQIQGIDPANKAINLAIATTIGAFAAMIAQPIAGMVSDRTRSRFGRRAPWMVGGAIVGGLSLIGISLANGLVQITIAWVCVQVAYNFAQGPLSAIMPDRVPRGVRGTFSALAGIGLMLGALGGQVVGSLFAKNIPAGYLFFAGLALVLIVLFVLFNKDLSNKSEPKPPFNFTEFLKTFWVSPIKHPDFFWGFTGRLLLYIGYFLVTGYQLFILQDYIGLKGNAVAVIPLLGLISFAGILISTAIGGPLSDKLGRRKLLAIIAGCVLAVALLVPWIMPTLTGMMIYSFISGLGFGAYQAVDTALMSEVLPSKSDFAKDLGVLNIAATLPQTLAPAVAGIIVVGLGGGYAALFPVGIVIALLGAFAVIPIKSVR